MAILAGTYAYSLACNDLKEKKKKRRREGGETPRITMPSDIFVDTSTIIRGDSLLPAADNFS